VAGTSLLSLNVGRKSPAPGAPPPPDIVFEDWKKGTYDGWTGRRDCVGAGPSRIGHAAVPGDVGGDTEYVVNSHATAPGKDGRRRDNATGKLTSRVFTIERDFIRFWIGGGSHKDKTCLNLVIAGQAVRTATGKDENRMTCKA